MAPPSWNGCPPTAGPAASTVLDAHRTSPPAPSATCRRATNRSRRLSPTAWVPGRRLDFAVGHGLLRAAATGRQRHWASVPWTAASRSTLAGAEATARQDPEHAAPCWTACAALGIDVIPKFATDRVRHRQRLLRRRGERDGPPPPLPIMVTACRRGRVPGPGARASARRCSSSPPPASARCSATRPCPQIDGTSTPPDYLDRFRALHTRSDGEESRRSLRGDEGVAATLDAATA